MTKADLAAAHRDLTALEAELARRNDHYKIDRYFLDEGPLRRELYAKHIECFAAGATFKERLFMAANRVGKSDAGAFEVTCHVTGVYPSWWTGRRFTEPVEVWGLRHDVGDDPRYRPREAGWSDRCPWLWDVAGALDGPSHQASAWAAGLD